MRSRIRSPRIGAEGADSAVFTGSTSERRGVAQGASETGRVFKPPAPKGGAAITMAALADPQAVPLTGRDRDALF